MKHLHKYNFLRHYSFLIQINLLVYIFTCIINISHSIVKIKKTFLPPWRLFRKGAAIQFQKINSILELNLKYIMAVNKCTFSGKQMATFPLGLLWGNRYIDPQYFIYIFIYILFFLIPNFQLFVNTFI